MLFVVVVVISLWKPVFYIVWYWPATITSIFFILLVPPLPRFDHQIFGSRYCQIYHENGKTCSCLKYTDLWDRKYAAPCPNVSIQWSQWQETVFSSSLSALPFSTLKKREKKKNAENHLNPGGCCAIPWNNFLASYQTNLFWFIDPLWFMYLRYGIWHQEKYRNKMDGTKK